MAIPFTQYHRPDGRHTEISIGCSAEIEDLAERFIKSGGRFEAEVLTTGHVSLSAVFEDEDGEPGDIAIEVVPNGPGIDAAIDRLVRASIRQLLRREAGCL